MRARAWRREERSKAAAGPCRGRGSAGKPKWCIDRKPLIGLIFQFNPSRTMPTPGTTQEPPTFESALAELEKIVASMEAGQMPLEQSLAAYKRGAELLKFCQSALQDAQQQIKILEENVLKSFGPAEQ